MNEHLSHPILVRQIGYEKWLNGLRTMLKNESIKVEEVICQDIPIGSYSNRHINKEGGNIWKYYIERSPTSKFKFYKVTEKQDLFGNIERKYIDEFNKNEYEDVLDCLQIEKN